MKKLQIPTNQVSHVVNGQKTLHFVKKADIKSGDKILFTQGKGKNAKPFAAGTCGKAVGCTITKIGITLQSDQPNVNPYHVLNLNGTAQRHGYKDWETMRNALIAQYNLDKQEVTGVWLEWNGIKDVPADLATDVEEDTAPQDDTVNLTTDVEEDTAPQDDTADLAGAA